jgi:DNA helicase-2/ATP-dependent DNA helicase PcrA
MASSTTKVTMEQLWKQVSFYPNENQRKAILHTEGPLFLTAGPGSGKTRVLLWRTLNLIVFHGVKPDKIFLSTFTEKAALQLKEGLRSLLGLASNYTSQPYDIAKMSLGTVHSICQQMLGNRNFSPHRERRHPPILLDELGQYFKIHNKSNWTSLCEAAGFDDMETAIYKINEYFGNLHNRIPKTSRHEAAISTIGLFNRFSEESLDPKKCKTENETLGKLLVMYQAYQDMLSVNPRQKQVDFSLLQKAAYEQIMAFSGSSSIYEHIIIDEYQDTNTIQEKIFFALAKGQKNICVVGDDDQALYRFRGATVENLVEFEKRCKKAIGKVPLRIDLDTNYRSRKKIVDAYTSFIQKTDWKKERQNGYYRIHDKNIKSDSSDKGISVVTTTPNPDKNAVNREVINLVYKLKQSEKISDYNQCAFLFPAMKNNTRVKDFIQAFEEFNEEMGFTGTNNEIKIYAPRAGRFLETEEAKAIWGLFMLIFDRPHGHLDMSFSNWIHECEAFAKKLIRGDENLKQFIEDRKEQISLVSKDYEILLKGIEENGLTLKEPFPSGKTKIFANLSGLSTGAERNFANKYFNNILVKREKDGTPFSTAYILNRATSVDWSVLDLFYQLCGFNYFREMFDKAERQKDESPDEGPICNLGLITQYLSRFIEERGTVITASFLKDDKFIHSFFSSFTYALFRLGESEYENADDPFPKGRIPFLTIHQSKGLEFPVVVLGSPDKRDRPADQKEEIIRELLPGKEGEPLEKIPVFDTMRMFYVALSRAQNLLVLPRFGKGKKTPPTSYWETKEFSSFFDTSNFPNIPILKIKSIPSRKEKGDDLGKSYSFTSDFLYYKKCPRQYMVMRKYGFVPSRSETMLFGSLVHETIDDLHNFLLDRRGLKT